MALDRAALGPIEAQRVMAILEETNEKLAFLSSITPDVLAHREELSHLAGEEISRTIAEQRVLEERFEELIATRAQLKGLSNKTRYRETQAEITNLNHALRESTKNLCRSLKDNPNVGENLLKIADERERLQDLVATTISELQEGRFDSLVEEVQREKDSRSRLADVVVREKESSSKVEELADALEAEKRAHTLETEEKRESIRVIKEELQKLKMETSTRRKCAAMEADAGTAAKDRSFRHTESSLREAITELQHKMDMSAMVHDETLSFLKKQQDDLNEKSAYWAEKLASDTEAKSLELKHLTAQRDADLEKLNELQARFDRDLAEQAAKEAEEARKAELARLKAIDDEKKRLAATLLQRVVGKAFRIQLEIAAAKKAAKKAGKKSKGKKK